MEERVNKLNKSLNEFMVGITKNPNLIYDYLDDLFEMSGYLKSALEPYFENDKINIKMPKIPYSGIDDKINIIKDFYREYGIEVDLDTCIQDGTIEFVDANVGEIPFNMNGRSFYSVGRDHKLIDVFNNGLMCDIPIIVHELGHMRNQPDRGRSQVGDLFTEGLARTDELLVLDYLEKLGYVDETEYFRLYLLKVSYLNAVKTYKILKAFLLFKELGDISRDSYKLFYDDDEDYELVISAIEKRIYDDVFFINNYVNYMFDTFISSHLFMHFKEDVSFTNVINELHKVSMRGGLSSCLNLMGLRNLIDDKEELFKSLDSYISFATKNLVNEPSL